MKIIDNNGPIFKSLMNAPDKITLKWIQLCFITDILIPLAEYKHDLIAIHELYDKKKALIIELKEELNL